MRHRSLTREPVQTAVRGRALPIVAAALLVAGLLALRGARLMRSLPVALSPSVDPTPDELEGADLPSPLGVASSIASVASGESVTAPAPVATEEPQLEVEYDPRPRGPSFDREGHRAYLELIYADVPLAELERVAWEVMQRSNTLAAQAFKDQRTRGLCNAAISTDGFTPRRVLDRRPTCLYLMQVAVESVELPESGIGVRHVEHYVREDEYPAVFRASEELRWLNAKIAALGGKGPGAR